MIAILNVVLDLIHELFVPTKIVREVNEVMQELEATHPCRDVDGYPVLGDVFL